MSAQTTLGSRTPARERRAGRLRYLAPLAVLIAVLLPFGWALVRDRDPHEIPSALIGHEVPRFSLPAVKGRTLGLSSAHLHGEVSLVNVFASWCVACREEHPLLLQMKAAGIVPIHGLNEKDQPDNAARWLNTFGDPYTRTGADLDGRVSIDWGVYGVPETFVISKDGHIAYKHIGPLTPKVLDETIVPLIERLRGQ